MNKNSESEVNHEPAEPELKDPLYSSADVWLGALSNASLMCFIAFIISIIFNDPMLLLGATSGAIAGGIASVFLAPEGCRRTGVRVRRLLGRDRQAASLGLSEDKLNTSVNRSDVQSSSTTSSHGNPDSADAVIMGRPDLDLFEFYDLSGEHTQDTNAGNKSTKLVREAH
jgi:hypothetical protein